MSEALPPAPVAPTTPATVVAATVLVGCRAVLALLAGVLLLEASPLRPRRLRLLGAGVTHAHPALGVLLLLWVALDVAIIVGLVVRAGWARIATFVLEGLAVVGAATRLGARPVASVLSIALSALIVAFLLSPSASEAFAGRT